MTLIKTFYKTATTKTILYSVFGLGIAYSKGLVTLSWCKEQIKEIINTRNTP